MGVVWTEQVFDENEWFERRESANLDAIYLF